MTKVLMILTLLFLFSCEEKQEMNASASELSSSEEISADAAALEENPADCDDKLLEGASVESEDLLQVNTGCSIEE